MRREGSAATPAKRLNAAAIVSTVPGSNRSAAYCTERKAVSSGPESIAVTDIELRPAALDRDRLRGHVRRERPPIADAALA
jgi:hypothetical protein